MLVLDTDHLTVLRYVDHPRCAALVARLRSAGAAGEETVTSVITLEEQMRGWMAEISRRRDVRRQVPAYDRLAQQFEFLRAWRILPFDDRAADHFERLRKQRVRIGSQDLKIASIALAEGATLLSANLRDFRQVPGLLVEDWLS